MRSLVIGVGVFLDILGVWCFLNHGVTFEALAFPIGIAMALSGSIQGIIHISIKNKIDNMAWLLSEAFVTIILGIIVLCNQLSTELVTVMFFGMWMIFIGCIRIVGGMALKKYHDNAWKWTISMGLLSLVVGVYHFTNSMLLNASIGILLGVVFLIYGTNILSLGVSMPHIKKNRKRINRN